MIGPQIPKELREKRDKESISRQERADTKSSDGNFPITTKEEETKSEDAPNGINSSDSSSDSDDEFMGPSLPGTKTSQNDETPSKLSLMQLHQEKLKNSGIETKNKITKYDTKKAFNDEIKKEMLRKLNMDGGLKGKFTSGLS